MSRRRTRRRIREMEERGESFGNCWSGVLCEVSGRFEGVDWAGQAPGDVEVATVIRSPRD